MHPEFLVSTETKYTTYLLVYNDDTVLNNTCAFQIHYFFNITTIIVAPDNIIIV
jgi:hypothetical protein